MTVIVQILNYAWSLGLPEGTARQLLIACRVLIPLAVVLLGLLVAGIWVPLDPRAIPPLIAGAVMAAAAGASCWVTGVIHNGDIRELTRLCADLARRVPPGEEPELLRAASGH